jgi:hypothetical protein
LAALMLLQLAKMVMLPPLHQLANLIGWTGISVLTLNHHVLPKAEWVSVTKSGCNLISEQSGGESQGNLFFLPSSFAFHLLYPIIK